MKTTLQFLDLHIHSSWHRLLEQYIEHWQGLTAVKATEVVIERQRNGRSAFRLQVRLEITAGTLHVETASRTLPAALRAATRDLERLIQDRRNERRARRAGERRLSAAAGPQMNE